MAETLTQSILVATDFSRASMLALDAAALLARQNDARCTLIHVFDPSELAPRTANYRMHAESYTLEAEVEQRIHDELRRLADDRLHGVPRAKTALVLSRNAAAGVCDYARKEGVDLIVVGTHGRTGLSHMLIGSVAEKVVRHAPCPVLTLRSSVRE